MSQARLVALQLSVMKNGVRVLSLDNKAVLRFLQEHNIFYEVCVVAVYGVQYFCDVYC